MNIYLVTRTADAPPITYDSYDSFVVVAPDAHTARSTHPSGLTDPYKGTWVAREFTQAQYMGVATPDVKPGVICASFNAG